MVATVRRLTDQDGAAGIVSCGKIDRLSDLTVRARPRMSDKAQGYAGSGIQNSSAMHGDQRLEALALHHLKS